MAYLTLTTLKGLTTAPAGYIDQIETAEAGWVANQLEAWSSLIDARLRKRYAVPFATPVPVQVTIWLAQIMDPLIYRKRGIDSTDEQFIEASRASDRAFAEIKEAADANTGLFDLPLHADTTAEGVSKGAPLGYAEQSPYTSHQLQREAADDE